MSEAERAEAKAREGASVRAVQLRSSKLADERVSALEEQFGHRVAEVRRGAEQRVAVLADQNASLRHELAAAQAAEDRAVAAAQQSVHAAAGAEVNARRVQELEAKLRLETQEFARAAEHAAANHRGVFPLCRASAGRALAQLT